MEVTACLPWQWASAVQGVRGHILSIFLPPRSTPVPSWLDGNAQRQTAWVFECWLPHLPAVCPWES